MAEPAIGGSILGCTINARPYAVAADADASRDLGGVTNEVQSNGDGTARLIQTRKPWKIGGLTLQLAEGQVDQEALQDVANRKDFVDITVTFASGLTYGGKGTITGDLEGSSQNATGEIELMGPGRLIQQ